MTNTLNIPHQQRGKKEQNMIEMGFISSWKTTVIEAHSLSAMKQNIPGAFSSIENYGGCAWFHIHQEKEDKTYDALLIALCSMTQITSE